LTLWIAALSLGISKGSLHLTVADIALAGRLHRLTCRTDDAKPTLDRAERRASRD
jgi:hypothetical protein